MMMQKGDELLNYSVNSTVENSSLRTLTVTVASAIVHAFSATVMFVK
jgi:hypothetical protein